jgi:triose/dihydroxyacetone kinase / FAD-AMP lyase (cyclizing)
LLGAVASDAPQIEESIACALQALPGEPNGVAAAASRAREGADQTAAMTRAKAGRAAYVGAAELSGHVDPGAEAVARVFAALANPSD